MSKSIKIYVFILLLFLAVIIAIDSNKPQPVDWRPTYEIRDKIPLGLYIFDHEISGLLKNDSVTKVSVSPYEFLDPLYDDDSLVKNYKIKGTFLSINEYPEQLDKESLKELFYFSSHGNTVFLSMKHFPQDLLDSLKLKQDANFGYKKGIDNWVINPTLGNQKYGLSEGAGLNYFSSIDTLKTTVLGYQRDDSTHINFIKVKYKNGSFILHTQPAAFTNYHLLYANHSAYAEKVLSYIPKGNVYWCVKGQQGEMMSSSALRYVFSQPALRAAWLLFVIGMLSFMIFNAKRKQRIVPIITPVTNTTVEFAKTIGNLYFQEGDHDNIIEKKIIYFLEKIRNEYLMDTTALDFAFIKKLHQKSGKPIQDIEKVVYLINQHRKQHFTSVEEDLIAINNAIEKVLDNSVNGEK